MTNIAVSPEVRDTLASNGAVVALESTIFSHLGLPSPANDQALTRCIAAIRNAGAVPAITAVIPYAGATEEFLIDPAGEATNIFNGQVVIVGSDGYLAISTATGADITTNNLGGSGVGAIGVCSLVASL